VQVLNLPCTCRYSFTGFLLAGFFVIRYTPFSTSYIGKTPVW
jgi:hypothetical protein